MKKTLFILGLAAMAAMPVTAQQSNQARHRALTRAWGLLCQAAWNSAACLKTHKRL